MYIGSNKSTLKHSTMADENKSDIHIGETQRIHWVEFDTASNDRVEIDYIIAKHHEFWARLEIICVHECCGLDAFRFYPEDIANASIHIDKEALNEDLVKLKLDLLKSDKDIIGSSRLNNSVDKGVFIKLLDHIIGYL